MARTITILFLLIFLSASAYAQKKYSPDRSGLKFLTGLMFYEKESDNTKLASGFFMGLEYELPLSPKSVNKPFVLYVVPEFNYWLVENSKNVGAGVDLRGKFKAGNTRPYIDLGMTFNDLSRAGNHHEIVGINAGAGIDILLSSSNVSIVIDAKVRAQVLDSKIKPAYSLTPGIRISL